jgi:speckle-type POZ protein
MQHTQHDRESSDLTIYCGENCVNKISVHKIILISRSPVFKAMLKSEFTEGNTNEITISDFHTECLSVFFKYLYMGYVTESDMKLHHVDSFRLADKYEVRGLFCDCEINMTKSLTIHNVASVLLLGDTQNSKYLTAVCSDFIKHNSATIFLNCGDNVKS